MFFIVLLFFIELFQYLPELIKVGQLPLPAILHQTQNLFHHKPSKKASLLCPHKTNIPGLVLDHLSVSHF